MTDEDRYLTVGQERRLVTTLLTDAGMTCDDACRVTDAIVLADCWGIPSQGLLRLPYYLRRLTARGYPPDAQLRTVVDRGPVIVLDGGGGLGHPQVWRAAVLASERAKVHGIGVAAVRNSGHCGALGVYTLPGLEDGMLSMVFSHGPAVMPPWEGTHPILSTSPLAAGIPTSPRPSIVDMATSAVARGDVLAHANRDERLPGGWAFDATGAPTDDPNAALAGMLAPMAGPKGYALAFLIESLTACLVGPVLSVNVPDPQSSADVHRPQSLAHLVISLAPSTFDADGRASADRFAGLPARITAAGGRIPGSARRLPHEIADDEALVGDASVIRDLRDWAVQLDSDHGIAVLDE